MKRLLLFVVLAGSGFGMLTWLAGGLGSGTRPRAPRRVMEPRQETTAYETENVIKAGHGLPDISEVEGIAQLAPPRTIVYQDRLSEETIEVPGFIPWRFYAETAVPMKRRDEGKQAVRCTQVAFMTFREPASRAEALALLRSDEDAYEPLRHQTFRADEARVFGRLADRMQRKSSSSREGDDTHIQLDGNVRIVDALQATTIKGDSVMVWPDQERADGRSRFTVEHEAFVLTGRGLEMERVKDKGWSRLAIRRNPVLDIVSDVKDRDGNPIFDFGPGDFKPAHITSEGRAILVREDRRREAVITVTFTDRVHAEQTGGRSLKAGRLKLVAERGTAPTRRAEGRGAGWKLRHFEAEDKVHVEYPRETARGKTYIASFSADRMLHEVPAAAAPRTTLDGDPVILMRGELPLLGPGGRLRASCRDRAWIGAVPSGLPTGDLPAERLQHIALRGQARVERTGPGGPHSDEDVLEGDAINLVVWQRESARTESADGEEADKMVATYFAALGNVRLGGTRIRGTTHRLIGERLHTEAPHLVAEGEGSRFLFPNIGSDQRLLGPADRRPADAAPSAPNNAAAGGGGAATAGGERRTKGRWLFDSLRAVGSVDIDTSMGGPAIGIPAGIEGHEVTYDRVSRRAQVLGAPAILVWGARGAAMNLIETPRLTFDRAEGVVTARGGVRGEIYMARRGGGALTMPAPERTGAGRGGASLSVRTDARIDIDLSGMGPSLKPLPGAELAIRIAGPATTELRNADMQTDRLQSDTLDVGMIYEIEGEQAPARTAPAAQAGNGGSTTSRGPTVNRPAAPEAEPERFDVTAGELRARLVDGEIRTLEATGNVDLRGEKSGHVSGARLAYDAGKRQAKVFASKPDWKERPAVAILGDTAQRTEIRGERLSMDWEDGAAKIVEAHSPRNGHAKISMFSRDAKRPGRLESYTLIYIGRVTMTAELMRAGRIRLVRKIRETGSSAWGPPAILYAASLRVLGTNMLSADEDVRDIRRMLAEGNDTMFQSGQDTDQIKVWGHVFDYDVRTKQATVRGRGGRDVTIQRGRTVHIDQSEITIDMKTNLPTYMRGGRIFWNPRKK